MSDATGFPVSPQQAQWWRNRDSQQAATYLQLVTDRAQEVTAMGERLAQQLASEEILRTRLHHISGMEYPLQVIEESSDVTLTEKDWRTLSDDQVAQHLSALTSALSTAERLVVHWIALPAAAGRQRFMLHLGAPGWMLDAMSLQLLAERILGLSEAPSEPLQYVDYGQWKQELLEAGPSEPGVAFWQGQQLTGSPSLGLETRTAGNSTGTSTGSRPVRLPFTLPASRLSELDAVAARQGLPLARLLQGTWQALLTRLAQPETMPVVWYEDGRNEDTFDALGLYGQTLACQHALRLDQTLQEQLEPFADTLSLAAGWQDYFAGLFTGPSAGARRDEKVPVFAWLNETETLRHSAFELYDSSGISAPTHLQLACFPQGNGELRCQLIADSTRYDAQALACLAEQWQQLLTAVVSGTGAALGRVPLLGEKQQQWIAPVFDDNLPLPPTFLHRWQQAVDRYPERVAVSNNDTRLTYQELNGRTNRVARYLQSRGVARGDIVGIHLPRGLDAIVAILATLKAGAAYLPLDPAYPGERLDYMIRDSGVRHLIGHGQAPVPGDLTYLTLHNDQELLKETSELSVSIAPEDTAYLIYTSGSVGQPKAVEISHGNLGHSLEARHRYYSKPVDAYLMLSSLSFDSSVAGIFWTLSQGGELVLPATGDERDTQVLLALMTRHRISHGLSLPSVYDALIGSTSAAQREALQESLTTWIVAGEACPESLVDKHHQHFPQAMLVNEYGPTEATVWATATELKPGHAVTIGQPVPGMGVYLLNEHDELAAVGEPGEIYLAGPQLAKGYRGKPEQTAQAFVTRPAIAGDRRLYRTGDLARWQANGHLQFLGRRDHQVKIRGHRIELGEIESRLTGHEGVKQAAVVARDAGNSQRLVAYLIATGDGVDTGALRDQLAATLPDYMVPGDFVVLPHFPLTPNGKLDIKALPEPERESGHPYTAPRNEVERILATIIGELLDRKQVGIHDNFFHIGGDSILSLQVVGRALSEGLSVSARDIFEQKTIANLAPKVATVDPDGRDPAPREQDAPLVALDDSELDALLDEVDNA